MKAMLTGFAAVLLIGVGAWYATNQLEVSSQDAYSSPNVRLE
jgi:hypothetical protein